MIRTGTNTDEVNWDDPLNRGLVAWWPMSKNGGNVLQELVTGSNGTLQNMNATSDYVLNEKTKSWGLELDGIDDYVNSPHHPRHNTITDQITISWWSKIGLGIIGGVISKYTTTGNQRSWSLKVTEASGFAQKVSFYTSDDGSNNTLSTFSGFSAIGEWQHHVMSWNAGEGRILYNGDLSNIGTASWDDDLSIFPGTADINIGARFNTDSELLEGSLADIRIWNRALADSEMRDAYESSVRQYPDQFKRRSFRVGTPDDGPAPPTFNPAWAAGRTTRTIQGAIGC